MLVRLSKQTNDQAFFFIISYRLRALKTLYFCKMINKKLKRFLQRILQEIMKKRIILGTSDAWLMSHSSQRPSDLYWRLSDFKKALPHCGKSACNAVLFRFLFSLQRSCDMKDGIKYLFIMKFVSILGFQAAHLSTGCMNYEIQTENYKIRIFFTYTYKNNF